MNTALTKFMEAARETNEQKYKIRAAEKEKENKRKLMELRQKQEQFAAENRQISDRRRQEYVKDGEGRRFIGMRRRNRRRIDENVTVRDERWMLVVSGNTIWNTREDWLMLKELMFAMSRIEWLWVNCLSLVVSTSSTTPDCSTRRQVWQAVLEMKKVWVNLVFFDDVDYNIYDKPLFNDKNSAYTFKVDRSAYVGLLWWRCDQTSLETDNTFAELKGIGDRLKSKEEDKVYKRVGPLAVCVFEWCVGTWWSFVFLVWRFRRWGEEIQEKKELWWGVMIRSRIPIFRIWLLNSC